jgi:hypothetical protein
MRVHKAFRANVIIGETKEDFQETVDLVAKYQFPVLFINQVTFPIY